MLEFILAWQNLVFCIPIAFGIVMVLGSALGFGDLGGDADVDLDVDADADLDIDGTTSGFNHLLGVLGVGKVPLIMVLMIASFVFGGVGLFANTLLGGVLPPILYAWISMFVAFVAMFIVTGRVAGLIARVMPSMETYLITRHDLCGTTGELILPLKDGKGFANVKAHDGTVFKIAVRADAPLAKGDPILVVDYEQETRTYVITRDPTRIVEDDGPLSMRFRVGDDLQKFTRQDALASGDTDNPTSKTSTTDTTKENE